MFEPLIPKPFCAVCNREVDDLQTDRDILSDTTIFTAVCHGERERVELTMELLHTVSGISTARAFVRAALPAAPKLLPAPERSRSYTLWRCTVCGWGGTAPRANLSCPDCHSPHLNAEAPHHVRW